MSKFAPKTLVARAKAKIEPQLHWRVPFETGKYSPRWSNKGKLVFVPLPSYRG
jgi:hypothetical protein